MTLRKSLLATSILAATLGLTGCGGSDNDEPSNSAPSAIALNDVKTVNENSAERQAVGTLTATDANKDDSHTFTTADDKFEIDGTTLYVKEGVSFDFEAASSVSVSVTVSDGKASFTANVEFSIADVNEAPTDVAISAQQEVKENLLGAQVVGTLSATDVDADDEVTLSTTTEGFVVEGTTLSLDRSALESKIVDFEQTPTIDVVVVATDKAGLKTEKTFTVNVTDEMDYDFLSKHPGKETESNVHYSGQIARHILIKELSGYMKGDFADDNTTNEDKINDFYKIGEYSAEGKLVDKEAAGEAYENLWGAKALTLSAASGAAQTELTSVSGSHKDLFGKIAGNDAKGQHKVWNDADSLVGWDGLEAANNTPRGLADALFQMLRENATEVAGGSATAPNGEEIAKAYVTKTGVDLQQLIEKFLFGAVAFSQGADDYLDDDTDGKGLLSAHDETDVDGKGYTKLEHQWDEGYGYFGAARNFLSYTDNEIAGKVEADESNGRLEFNGKQDTNGDGDIDLLSEYNWGNSTNAAKRDRTEVTDLTKEAYMAFFEGRKLLNDTAGTPLTETQAAELKEHAVTATLAWEKAIVATVIHYINDVLDNSKGDIDDIKSKDYTADNFYAFAKHWSEMKGFALNMQFNPVSPFNKDADMQAKFAELHTYMKNAPIIEGEEAIEAYKTGLVKARDILRDAYEWKDKDGKVLTGDDLEALVAGW